MAANATTGNTTSTNSAKAAANPRASADNLPSMSNCLGVTSRPVPSSSQVTSGRMREGKEQRGKESRGALRGREEGDDGESKKERLEGEKEENGVKGMEVDGGDLWTVEKVW